MIKGSNKSKNRSDIGGGGNEVKKRAKIENVQEKRFYVLLYKTKQRRK